MNKKLVAYFSASGVTAKVATNLSEAIGADLYEIKPEVPYTKADLNARRVEPETPTAVIFGNFTPFFLEIH